MIVLLLPLKAIPRYRKLKLLDIQWMDSIDDYTAISNYDFTITSPSYLNEDKVIKQNNNSCINLYTISNAIVCNKTSSIISGKKVIIEKVNCQSAEISNYSAGYVLQHTDMLAVVDSKDKIISLESGFFLCGNGSFNYYHWLIEILPKLELFSRLNLDCVILVSNLVNRHVNFGFLLSSAISYLSLKVKIIYLDDDTNYLVNKLYTVNSPNNLVYNTRLPVSNLDYCVFNKEALSFISELGDFIEHYSSQRDSKPYDKIFLARSSDIRSYNQDEVILTVKKYGFEPVYLETMSIPEQIHTFKNASFIIGASGAAWANIIFASESAKCISWLPSNMSLFPIYSTIADFKKVDMKFLTYISSNLHYHSHYHVSTDEIRNAIEHFFALEKI